MAGRVGRFECVSCGGTYDEESGGSLYFHACASVPNPSYQADPRLPRYDPRQLVAREGARDESPDLDAEIPPAAGSGQRQHRPRAEGRGRVRIGPDDGGDNA